MRRTTKLTTAISACAVIGLLSCTGGGGALDPHWDGWDHDTGNLSERERPVGGEQDRPGNSELPADSLPSEKDKSPGAGPGALVCGGIYECVLTGTTRTCVSTGDGPEECTEGRPITIRVRIRLQEQNGVCFIGEAALEPGGVLRGDDEDEVGRWFVRGDQIVIEAGEVGGYCFPSSGPEGLVGSDGQVSEGSSVGGSGGGAGAGSVEPDPP